jgi:hypothetical protein
MPSLPIDYIALIVALWALWYTIRESHHNNNVVLKILEFQASYRQATEENRGQPFHLVKLLIRNHGISLHNLRVILAYDATINRGGGSISVQFSHKPLPDGSEFAKGMVAEFVLKSYELEKHEIEMLKLIKNPSKQHAKLCIYSQNYLAYQIRIGGMIDYLKSKWNSFAFSVNRMLTSKIGTSDDGIPVIRTFKILPTFIAREQNLANFLEGISED